ncbi:MAG: hypothetical protein H8D78_09030 [Chloroflexi bacterium]|nr:hypothetical protein [Chloroflexota bacterium]
MRKGLVKGFLVLLLLAGGCVPPTPSPQPLTLPATLFDATMHGHRVTLVLQTACQELTPPQGVSAVAYCLHADIHVVAGGMVEVNVVQLDLPKRYRQGQSIQPEQAMGGGGTGGGWTEPGAYELNLPFRPLQESAPVALFLEMHTRSAAGQPLSSQKLGPVVLQLLPDGRGVARLDD